MMSSCSHTSMSKNATISMGMKAPLQSSFLALRVTIFALFISSMIKLKPFKHEPSTSRSEIFSFWRSPETRMSADKVVGLKPFETHTEEMKHGFQRSHREREKVCAGRKDFRDKRLTFLLFPFERLGSHHKSIGAT